MIFILPVYFKVNFRITDPDGQSSEWTPLYIRVKSRHSMAPIATENNGLILYEGQQRCIGSESLLLSDEDSAIAKMDIRVMDGMKHGNIFVRSNSENVFTGEDLELCDVVYQHDDRQRSNHTNHN